MIQTKDIAVWDYKARTDLIPEIEFYFESNHTMFSDVKDNDYAYLDLYFLVNPFTNEVSVECEHYDDDGFGDVDVFIITDEEKDAFLAAGEEYIQSCEGVSMAEYLKSELSM